MDGLALPNIRTENWRMREICSTFSPLVNTIFVFFLLFSLSMVYNSETFIKDLE